MGVTEFWLCWKTEFTLKSSVGQFAYGCIQSSSSADSIMRWY